jgi:nicotinate-nucleotide adenylyltransferase
VLDISASDVRARIARGEDVAALVPEPVLAYIRKHGLYR